MAAKAILVLCAQALLIQSALSQCAGPAGVSPIGLGGNGWGHDGLGRDNLSRGHNWGYNSVIPISQPAIGVPCTAAAMEVTSATGGVLPVTSASAIPPVGISIVSENAFEGLLTVAGEIPFVGTTGMEGALPTGGAGAINYGCGSGVTAMVSDVAPAAGFAPAIGAAASSPAAAVASGFAPSVRGYCDRGYAI